MAARAEAAKSLKYSALVATTHVFAPLSPLKRWGPGRLKRLRSLRNWGGG